MHLLMHTTPCSARRLRINDTKTYLPTLAIILKEDCPTRTSSYFSDTYICPAPACWHLRINDTNLPLLEHLAHHYKRWLSCKDPVYNSNPSAYLQNSLFWASWACRASAGALSSSPGTQTADRTWGTRTTPCCCGAPPTSCDLSARSSRINDTQTYIWPSFRKRIVLQGPSSYFSDTYLQNSLFSASWACRASAGALSSSPRTQTADRTWGMRTTPCCYGAPPASCGASAPRWRKTSGCICRSTWTGCWARPSWRCSCCWRRWSPMRNSLRCQKKIKVLPDLQLVLFHSLLVVSCSSQVHKH